MSVNGKRWRCGITQNATGSDDPNGVVRCSRPTGSVVRFELDTDADDEQLDTLVRLTERYCVVLQTIVRAPEISISR